MPPRRRLRGPGRASQGGWIPTGAQISDLDNQIERLMRCEILKESEVKALCDKAREIMIDEANVQRVDTPVTVRGAAGGGGAGPGRGALERPCVPFALEAAPAL